MKALLLCLVLVLSATAQPDRDLGRLPPRARRLALVIGNDAYAPPANPLHNAVNDARSMKAALEDVGFTVQISLNATQQQMETAIDDFTGSVRRGDVALFFYSGHGMQISDQNYLVPVDFQARTAIDAKYKPTRHNAYRKTSKPLEPECRSSSSMPVETTRSGRGVVDRMDSPP